MEQKIPNINDSDIKRIVERDFPQTKFSEIKDILRKYKSESTKGRNRIYASILKLSCGSVELIKKWVKKANDDYRDVIAKSEYPGYSQYAFDSDLSEEREEQIIKDDWLQYESWLNKSK